LEERGKKGSRPVEKKKRGWKVVCFSGKEKRETSAYHQERGSKRGTLLPGRGERFSREGQEGKVSKKESTGIGKNQQSFRIMKSCGKEKNKATKKRRKMERKFLPFVCGKEGEDKVTIERKNTTGEGEGKGHFLCLQEKKDREKEVHRNLDRKRGREKPAEGEERLFVINRTVKRRGRRKSAHYHAFRKKKKNRRRGREKERRKAFNLQEEERKGGEKETFRVSKKEKRGNRLQRGLLPMLYRGKRGGKETPILIEKEGKSNWKKGSDLPLQKRENGQNVLF